MQIWSKTGCRQTLITITVKTFYGNKIQFQLYGILFFDQKDTGDNYIVLKISHTSICFNVNLLDFSSRDFKNTSLVQPLKY